MPDGERIVTTNEPWLARWREGHIGWHESGGNAGLKKHWQARGRRVLVPLCGKSVDLLWLAARGNTVIGVEVSEIAVRAFFDENAIPYCTSHGPLTAFAATDRDITIYCGDFFEFDVAGCDAWYDRGALVAMPPDRRPAYAARVNHLLAENAYKLLVTLEYDAAVAAGPPFSISDAELLGYWPQLQLVDRYDDIQNGPPKFLEAGLTEMFESVWRHSS